MEARIFKFEDNINTDIIISGKYLRTEDTDVFKKHVFEVIRGENFYQQVNSGDVIIAKKNFGCGSSREQAALAVKLAGFKAVIAKSFGRIFFRNMINLGVPALILKENHLSDEIFNQILDKEIIDLDMKAGKAYIGVKGVELQFYPLSDFTQTLINTGGLMNYAKQKISNHTR